MMKTEDIHELPTYVIIDGQALSSAQVLAVARHNATVNPGSESISRIQAARVVIEILTVQNEKVYGVTTGRPLEQSSYSTRTIARLTA